MDADRYSVFFTTGQLLTRLDVRPDEERWYPTVPWLQVYPELAFLMDGSLGFRDNHVFQIDKDIIAIGGLLRLFDLRRGRVIPSLGPGHSKSLYSRWWNEETNQIGATIAAGPTVLMIGIGNEDWNFIAHVPTRAVSGPFSLRLLPSASQPLVFLPDRAEPESDRRILYAFPSEEDLDEAGTLTMFRRPFTDPFDRTTEQVVDHFPGLASVNGVVDCAWLVYGRFDVSPWVRFTKELPDEFFFCLKDTADQFGHRAWDLAAVGEVESGLRLDAYHPADRYGFLGLAAEDIADYSSDPPHSLFALSPHDQFWLVRQHLDRRGVRNTASEAHTWAGMLVPDFDVVGASLDTVVAGPDDDPALLARLARFDRSASGTVTLGDLAAALEGVMTGPRWEEIRARIEGRPPS
ncbi:hypothetical protein [Streptomyces chartreusis]|uniref:hypothetical protein n=1 Tax=Streptomyces chartreusis TaxID=1969 RepID=UPI0038278DD7